jgi:hypothetical protein
MRHRVSLAILGLLSLGLYLGMTGISREFNWGEGYALRPIPAYLALYFALFALYAGAVALVLKHLDDNVSLWIILAFGLLFRAAIFPSNQIQEDDVYRYLWDGKVFAHGINPYEYPPKLAGTFKFLQIREPEEFKRLYDERNARELEQLYNLKWENPAALSFYERVNHPDVPSIYPPLAQHVFRAVHWVRPDSILAMRSAFLLFDLGALVFIILTLEVLGKNRNLCLIYFWSPLIIKETFNSTHLDIIGIAFLCASLYFFVRTRFSAATFFLALSVLGKLYPIILLPLYLKETIKSKNTAWASANAALFLLVIGLVYSPFLDIGMKAFAGLGAYAARWQNNDSLFAILLFIFESVPGLQAVSFYSVNLAVFLTKATVASTLLGTVAYLLFRQKNNAGELSGLRDIFLMMGLVFLLSPVQNPWYLGWVVPFLCFFPRNSWILLTGLVGLYYLDFYFVYQEVKQYSSWIAWVEYPPFYILLARELSLLQRIKIKLSASH